MNQWQIISLFLAYSFCNETQMRLVASHYSVIDWMSPFEQLNQGIRVLNSLCIFTYPTGQKLKNFYLNEKPKQEVSGLMPWKTNQRGQMSQVVLVYRPHQLLWKSSLYGIKPCSSWVSHFYCLLSTNQSNNYMNRSLYDFSHKFYFILVN